MKTSTVVTLAVTGLFLLMAGAWTAMFTFARRAHVESVPLSSAAAPTSRTASSADAAAGPVAAEVAEVR